MDKKITIASHDRERLLKLIREERKQGNNMTEKNLRELEHELIRADICDPESMPEKVITMNSKILLRDLDSDEEMSYELVYPEDADLLNDRISILAPVGTALLGFEEGDVIDWSVPDGTVQLKVEKVIYQPESAGNFDL